MPRIRVIGLKELQKALNTKEAQAEIKRIVRQNGSELQRKAQEKAPVGTPESTGIPGYIGGTLKRSIGIEIKDGGMTAEVEPTAEYAPYVELGTRFMDAKSYLKPAYEEQKEKFKSDMRKLVR